MYEAPYFMYSYYNNDLILKLGRNIKLLQGHNQRSYSIKLKKNNIHQRLIKFLQTNQLLAYVLIGIK